MKISRFSTAAIIGLAMQTPVWAADGTATELPVWSALPFALLLLTIAIVPLFASHFWDKNRHKALLAAALAAPIVIFLWSLNDQTEGWSLDILEHQLRDYASFIMLLAALFTVSGGVLLRGDVAARPLTNTTLLALGAVLANFIGTTGASMLLIRPMLRINERRVRRSHIPLFFIFIVSNLGGLLTPLGDPPLFLGFLNGVRFSWTLRLWGEWAVANGTVLGVFFLWDAIAKAREPSPANTADPTPSEGIRIVGKINFLLLVGIVAAVLFQSPAFTKSLQELLAPIVACPELRLLHPWPEIAMAGISVLSLLLTPRGLRKENGFSWHPIAEVAILFAGIFVTMVPALEVLKTHSKDFNLTEPWQYFWLTGGLSSFLDNAPTYMVFATVAADGTNLGRLATNQIPGIDGPLILAAISCGAVFMGANTYIGNGPNFMVKAIAEKAGYRMPGFLTYVLYSSFILLPTFVVITYVFFRP
jgi:Na+/H+ antiporter NhaD/arsenite permease-like protein